MKAETWDLFHIFEWN